MFKFIAHMFKSNRELEEEWLAKSIDLADLERRQRLLQSRGFANIFE